MAPEAPGQASDWQCAGFALFLRENPPIWRKAFRGLSIGKGVHMSAQQKEEQRNSFVCGNTRIENANVTREMVEAISKRVPNKLTI
jgi:hypothetical protein